MPRLRMLNMRQAINACGQNFILSFLMRSHSGCATVLTFSSSRENFYCITGIL